MRVRVAKQATQVLLILLEEPGRVRSREELKQRLWPLSRFGDFDHGLNKCISCLRAALRDPARDPMFIQTLAREGYRFIGAIETPHDRDRPKSWRRMPVAVLPFSAPDDDPELAFLSHEIASELIDRIGEMESLRVVAYGLVRSAAEQDGKDLATRFGARAIVLGELNRYQERLSVHVEMVDILDGTQFWGMHFRSAMETAITSPECICDEIVERVRALCHTGSQRQAEASRECLMVGN